MNRRCDGETADEIVSTFMQLVIAPGYDAAALTAFTAV